MIRKYSLAGLSMLLFSAAGCNSISDMCLEKEMCCRDHVLVHKAWAEWSWCYDELDHPHHFAKGFRAGYDNILGGGKGCQPTMPPRCYWKPCYQTPEGQCQTQSWFDGFSHGALAAQQDGYGNLQTIPLSSTARQNFLTAKLPASNACFAEHGEPSEPIQDGLLEMPGPLNEGEAPIELPDGQLIESAVPGSGVPGARPYDE